MGQCWAFRPVRDIAVGLRPVRLAFGFAVGFRPVRDTFFFFFADIKRVEEGATGHSNLPERDYRDFRPATGSGRDQRAITITAPQRTSEPLTDFTRRPNSRGRSNP